MSLTDILSTTDLKVIIDRKIAGRSESDRTLIAVKQVKADNASDFLARALALEETPIAAITDSGSVYILSPGTHGLICVQGSSANKTQKATLEKLAKAYSEATGLMLPDWYSPKLDPDKVVKEPTTPVEVDPPADAEPLTPDDTPA